MNVEKAVDDIEEAVAIYEECYNQVCKVMLPHFGGLEENDTATVNLMKDVATTVFITVSRKK
jgi:hypothetical protein